MRHLSLEIQVSGAVAAPQFLGFGAAVRSGYRPPRPVGRAVFPVQLAFGVSVAVPGLRAVFLLDRRPIITEGPARLDARQIAFLQCGWLALLFHNVDAAIKFFGTAIYVQRLVYCL